jgi:hypothetical protein
LLQGWGALGAYQAGVYEALAEAGIQPDWVAGVSVGAINAAKPLRRQAGGTAMARKDHRLQRNECGDRGALRGAQSVFAPVALHDLHPFTPRWGELALTAVVVMGVAPALIVGFLLLLEAALPSAIVETRCAGVPPVMATDLANAEIAGGPHG